MTSYDVVPRSVPAARANQPNPPRQRTPLGICDHHMAGYLPGTDGMFQDPDTGYSTNYGIGSDGRGNYVVHEYVPADYVAWGNGNDFLNRVAVSIEHENNRAAGPASKPTPETHELSARFHAALAIKYNWVIDGKVQLVLRDFPNHDFYGKVVPGFGTEFNVIGHRAVALKDCPRDLDMQWICDRANEIISGTTPEERKDIMKIISDKTGVQKFADEFGVDDIGAFFFVPNGPNGNPSWVDNIQAAWLLAGKPEEGREGSWDVELARHIGNARWAQKKGEIVTDMVNALSPLLQQIANAVAGIDANAVKAAIAEGLKNVVVEPEALSDEDKEEIAKATRDLFRDDPLK